MQIEKAINTRFIPLVDKYWYVSFVIIAVMFLFSNNQDILSHRLFIGLIITVFAIHVYFSHRDKLYLRLNYFAKLYNEERKALSDYKVTVSFREDMMASEIEKLKEQLKCKSADRRHLEFLGEVGDYLEKKAGEIKHSKPNTADILTLAMVEVDLDYKEQEEKIKANS